MFSSCLLITRTWSGVITIVSLKLKWANAIQLKEEKKKRQKFVSAIVFL